MLYLQIFNGDMNIMHDEPRNMIEYVCSLSMARCTETKKLNEVSQEYTVPKDGCIPGVGCDVKFGY